MYFLLITQNLTNILRRLQSTPVPIHPCRHRPQLALVQPHKATHVAPINQHGIVNKNCRHHASAPPAPRRHLRHEIMTRRTHRKQPVLPLMLDRGPQLRSINPRPAARPTLPRIHRPGLPALQRPLLALGVQTPRTRRHRRRDRRRALWTHIPHAQPDQVVPACPARRLMHNTIIARRHATTPARSITWPECIARVLNAHSSPSLSGSRQSSNSVNLQYIEINPQSRHAAEITRGSFGERLRNGVFFRLKGRNVITPINPVTSRIPPHPGHSCSSRNTRAHSGHRPGAIRPVSSYPHPRQRRCPFV
jgi:hypothetical protein